MGQFTRRLAALAFVGLLAMPGAALADGKHRHSSHHRHGASHQHHERHDVRHQHWHQHRHQQWQRQRHDSYRKAGRFHAAPRYGQVFALQGFGCHPVTGIDYHLGHRAKVGGTLCYDAYGRAFIVPGSRYVIGFLY